MYLIIIYLLSDFLTLSSAWGSNPLGGEQGHNWKELQLSLKIIAFQTFLTAIHSKEYILYVTQFS